MGYSSHHKGYRCLATNGRIYISKDVVFNEKSFPLRSMVKPHPHLLPHHLTFILSLSYIHFPCQSLLSLSPSPSPYTPHPNPNITPSTQSHTNSPHALPPDLSYFSPILPTPHTTPISNSPTTPSSTSTPISLTSAPSDYTPSSASFFDSPLALPSHPMHI